MNKPGKQDLYIICEGITEEIFLKRMKLLFESEYNLFIHNAKGADKILSEYSRIRRVHNYSDIIMMYDLDGIKTLEDIFKTYKSKGINISKNSIYFINPKFELILVLCKDKKMPIGNYEKIIKELYGVENYKTESHLNHIACNISEKDISDMIKSIRSLSKNPNDTRSTNYDELFDKIFKIH